MRSSDQTPIQQILNSLDQSALGKGRQLIALAGPPASGKSTLAQTLCTALNERRQQAKVIPMDGFHLDNQTLQSRDLLHRKGAPNTFDAHGFIALIKQLKTKDFVNIPHFDRATDAVIPNADQTTPSDKILIVEGNYLLLNQSPWEQLGPLFDLKVFLSVPKDELRRRLIGRWLDHGLTQSEATKRAEENDLPNALTTVKHSRGWDLKITTR